MKLTQACSILVLSLASAAFAQQDGTFPPEGGRDGRRPQEGERPARPAIDPAQFIERLMQNDANGDGVLSKDELPPAMAERLMERGDTNKDGMLDKGELEAAAKNGAVGSGRGAPRDGGGRPAPREGAAPGAMDLEGAMKQMNRATTALRSSNFDEASRPADLSAVQTLQGAVIASKGAVARLRMSDAAKARFGEDRARFEAEYRTMMLDTLIVAIELEKAVLAGDASGAKSAVARLKNMQSSGHDLFQPSEQAGGEAPARPERPARPEGGRPRGGRPADGSGTRERPPTP
jgi:hypothetical protein